MGLWGGGGGERTSNKGREKADLYLSRLDRSYLPTWQGGTCMPITYRLAAHGTTAAPGCSTFFFAISSRDRKLFPTRPAENFNSNNSNNKQVCQPMLGTYSACPNLVLKYLMKFSAGPYSFCWLVGTMSEQLSVMQLPLAVECWIYL